MISSSALDIVRHNVTMRRAFPKDISKVHPIQPNLCDDCKYFFAQDNNEMGICAKFIVTDPNDGSIDYKYAKIIRMFDCKGDYWEKETEQ